MIKLITAFLLFFLVNVYCEDSEFSEENLQKLKCVKIPDATTGTGYARITVSQLIAQKESHNHHNMIIKMASKKMNEQFDELTSINIDYEGEALSGQIGQYLVRAFIKRMVDNEEVSECYTVDYWVEDVDECELGTHKCHSTAQCLNTPGSYECKCPTGFYGVEGSGSVSYIKTMYKKRPAVGICGGKKTTSKCCATSCVPEKSSADCLDHCKSDFRCTNDPCLNNKCNENAQCVPDMPAHSYECQCNEGYAGDGFSCEKTAPKNYCVEGIHTCVSPCVCTNQFQDGGYTCDAPSGYVTAHNPFATSLPYDHVNNGGKRLDHNYCFHSDGMDLHLEGPNPLYYKQGDSYEEYSLQLSDSQPENFVRKVSILYSSPFGMYFKVPATYNVSYTVQTPWMEKSGHTTNITKIRKVVVGDIDECTYTGDRPMFVHQCAAGAECVNTYGSYECKCPSGYAGDGMKNGTACYDVQPPTLVCIGKGCQPMKFKAVSEIGIMSEDSSIYEMEAGTDMGFIDMFLEKHKHSLCSATDPCYMAYDDVMTGRIDLTSRVTLGSVKAVSRTPHHISFVLPYTVKDDSDNAGPVLNLELEVEIVNVLERISGTDISVSRRKQLGILSLLLLAVLTLVIFFIPSFLRFIRVALYALQFVLCPYSMISRRQDFEEGMDLVLTVMSLGMMTKTERARRTAAKWMKLVDSVDED